MLGLGGRLEFPGCSRLQSERLHPSGDTGTTQAPALRLQRLPHPRRTIAPLMRVEHPTDGFIQAFHFGLPIIRSGPFAGVIPTPPHVQHPAHGLDRKGPFLRLDPRVLYLDSLAKYAAAFFRIATSSSR